MYNDPYAEICRKTISDSQKEGSTSMHTFLKLRSSTPLLPQARIPGCLLAAFLPVGLCAAPAQADPAIKSIASLIGNGSYINGNEPRSGVVLDNSGNIFETAYYGGSDNRGTVYEIVHGTNTIKALASFNGYNSAYPTGSIAMDSGGNIYGATEGDGTASTGTIYKLDSGTSTVTTLASFDRG